jgi:hypothetical protein
MSRYSPHGSEKIEILVTEIAPKKLKAPEALLVGCRYGYDEL